MGQPDPQGHKAIQDHKVFKARRAKQDQPDRKETRDPLGFKAIPGLLEQMG